MKYQHRSPAHAWRPHYPARTFRARSRSWSLNVLNSVLPRRGAWSSACCWSSMVPRICWSVREVGFFAVTVL